MPIAKLADEHSGAVTVALIYVCYKRRKSRVPSGYGRPVTGASLPANAYGGKSDSRLIVGQTAASKI